MHIPALTVGVGAHNKNAVECGGEKSQGGFFQEASRFLRHKPQQEVSMNHLILNTSVSSNSYHFFVDMT